MRVCETTGPATNHAQTRALLIGARNQPVRTNDRYKKDHSRVACHCQHHHLADKETSLGAHLLSPLSLPVTSSLLFS